MPERWCVWIHIVMIIRKLKPHSPSPKLSQKAYHSLRQVRNTNHHRLKEILSFRYSLPNTSYFLFLFFFCLFWDGHFISRLGCGNRFDIAVIFFFFILYVYHHRFIFVVVIKCDYYSRCSAECAQCLVGSLVRDRHDWLFRRVGPIFMFFCVCLWLTLNPFVILNYLFRSDA